MVEASQIAQVIRVPIETSSSDGLDSLVSIVQGIQVESLLDEQNEEASSSPPSQYTEVEEFKALLHTKKIRNSFTEQALHKSQPLVISNITHEKVELLTAGDLKGRAKLEQLCLQLLSVRICLGGAVIDVLVIDSSSASTEETNQPNGKSTPAAASAIPDTDLAEIIRVIRSCRDGINKLVESLQQRFPSVSKSQPKSKVREISDFVDNHWQVKKEVLDKLGLNYSPGTQLDILLSVVQFYLFKHLSFQLLCTQLLFGFLYVLC